MGIDSWYMMVMQALGMGLTAVVSAVGGWLAARVKSARKESSDERSRQDAVVRVCRDIAGRQIDEALSKAAAKPLDNAECTLLLKQWNVYHALGGDGLRTARVEKAIGMELDE